MVCIFIIFRISISGTLASTYGHLGKCIKKCMFSQFREVRRIWAKAYKKCKSGTRLRTYTRESTYILISFM